MSEFAEANQDHTTPGELSILVLWGEVNSNDVDESALNDWWTNEHLPERLSIHGFLRARRYYSRDDANNTTSYLTLYEVAGLPILTSSEYMEKLNNPTTRTRYHIPTLVTMNRSACEVVRFEARPEFSTCRSHLAGTLAMIVFHLAQDGPIHKVLESTTRDLSNLLKGNKDVVCFRILQENRGATEPGSSSKSYDDVKIRSSDDTEGTRCFVLLEFSNQPFTESRSMLDPFVDRLKAQNELRSATTLKTYNFMCSLSN